MGINANNNSHITGSGFRGHRNNINANGNTSLNVANIDATTENKSTAKKISDWTTIIISSIAIALSIITFYKGSMCYNAQFAISALLALTTILITWQIIHFFVFITQTKENLQKSITTIYHKIDINKKALKELFSVQIDTIKNEYNTQIENIQTNHQSQLSEIREYANLQSENGTGLALLQIACLLHDNANDTLLGIAFVLFCNGITLLNGDTELNKDALENSIPRMKNTCRVLIDELTKQGKHIVDKDYIYLKAAIKTGDNELIELVKKVTSKP